MKYNSKVDVWVHLVFLLLIAVNLLLIYLTVASFNGVFLGCTLFFTALNAGCFLPLRFNTWYELGDYGIKLRFGYFTSRIDYFDIVSVRKTFNPLSSCALSLRRIEIIYKSGAHENMVLISPENRDEFINELISKNILIKKL